MPIDQYRWSQSYILVVCLLFIFPRRAFSGATFNYHDHDLDKFFSQVKEIEQSTSKTEADKEYPGDPNLPNEHYPYYFGRNRAAAEACKLDENCPYKEALDMPNCWGYEDNCHRDHMYDYPTCAEHFKRWSPTMEEQLDRFWKMASFGFIKERMEEMTILCKPESAKDSLLECTKYLRHCHAKNLFIDFTKFGFEGSRDRFKEDIFAEGQIGGHCTFSKDELKSQSQHKSPLQSWYGELNNYTSLDFYPEAERCDVVIDKPTYLFKLDSGINLYHHYCDFINLYMSQHINNSFSTDVFIVMWDTSGLVYNDFFSETWKAFTDYPILPLKAFEGKKICFKEAVFPLLARMRRGFYYNMPMIPGCVSRGVMRAFSQHVLKRLGITQQGPSANKVRVTLLDRKTKHRNIINQQELVNALKKEPNVEVHLVHYHRKMPFVDQLQITHNSDVFIGMHGAGLTHLIYQPDWGVTFELYNTEDPGCYRDLAYLRGVNYVTWKDTSKLIKHNETLHPTLKTPHEKFTNYSFDVDEFLLLVRECIKLVKNHSMYRKLTFHNEKAEL